MKKNELSKQETLLLADKVLGAVRISEEEVDRIVASPRLFDPVRSAIESGVMAEPRESLPAFHMLRWQTVMATVSVVTFVAAAVGLSDLLSPAAPSPIARTVVTNPTTADVSSPTTRGSGPEEREIYSIKQPEQRRRKAVATRKTKRKSAQTPGPAESESFSEFYALTYAGDLKESQENGQLVRVELPRESLFAMGIKIPTENEADKIKTDLLIGEDGIVKAIRLVN
jgi:hypothetical protein